jgi:hypothetical protein
MDAISDEYSLRIATSEDRANLSLLFPTGTFNASVNVVVAWNHVGRSRRVGAVSAARMVAYPNYQFVIDIHVLPGYKETALHSLLLEKLLSNCPHGFSILCRTLVPTDSLAAQALVAHNFLIRDVIHDYELPYAVFVRRIARLHARLLRERPNRDGFLLQPLSDASLPAVAAVLKAADLMPYAEFKNFCQPRDDFDSVRFSSVAMHDGDVLGVILVMQSPQPDAVSIPCVWIHPKHRNSWLLSALYQRSLSATSPLSLEAIHFSADIKIARDTVNLASKLGAQLMAIKGRFQRLT